ncbi:MAG: helix-turn-helix domain-containing protein [Nitrospinota bacterium]
MGSLGSYLKSEREARGLSIEEVAHVTNIGKKFLVAIENDANEELPSHTVTIGFLRAYSKSIGINSDEVVEKYNEYLVRLEQARVENISNNTEPNPLESANIKFILTIVGSLALIILLVVILSKLNSTPRKAGLDFSDAANSVEKPPPPSKNSPPLVSSSPVPSIVEAPGMETPGQGTPKGKDAPHNRATDPVEKTVPEKTMLSKSEEGTPPSPLSATALSPLKLIITAHEKAWINVVIDGDKIRDVILPENQTLTVKAETSFLFSTGNMKGIKLLLNGEPLDLPEKKGRVLKNFLITEENWKVSSGAKASDNDQ